MPDGSSADGPGSDQANTKAEGEHPRGWSWPQFCFNAGLIAGAIGMIVWFVVVGVVPNVSPKNFGVVEPGVLYRSGELTPRAIRTVVETHGVRTIIDFGAHDLDPAGEARERAVAQSLGVRRVVLPLWGDATGDPNRYADGLRLVTDPANHPLLVHCAAGSERTGCFVALFRHLEQGWDADRALAEATEHRHDPDDNPRLAPMFHEWVDEIDHARRTGEPIDSGGVESSPFPIWDSDETFVPLIDPSAPSQYESEDGAGG